MIKKSNSQRKTFTYRSDNELLDNLMLLVLYCWLLQLDKFITGDFVLVKNSEQNKTKLDNKFRDSFFITAALEVDSLELTFSTP